MPAGFSKLPFGSFEKLSRNCHCALHVCRALEKREEGLLVVLLLVLLLVLVLLEHFLPTGAAEVGESLIVGLRGNWQWSFHFAKCRFLECHARKKNPYSQALLRLEPAALRKAVEKQIFAFHFKRFQHVATDPAAQVWYHCSIA